jgi:hypothetical protein
MKCKDDALGIAMGLWPGWKQSDTELQGAIWAATIYLAGKANCRQRTAIRGKATPTLALRQAAD